MPGINNVAITLVLVPIIFIMLYKTITKNSYRVSEKTFSIIVIAIFMGMIVSSLFFGLFGNESLQPENNYEIR